MLKLPEMLLISVYVHDTYTELDDTPHLLWLLDQFRDLVWVFLTYLNLFEEHLFSYRPNHKMNI